MIETLPKTHQQFADKYFLRTNEILKAENYNPFVRAQVFVRKGPGTTAGIEDAINVLTTYSDLEKNGGRIYALNDGVEYSPSETQIVIEARIQDIVEHETMYLGVLSQAVSELNDNTVIDLDQTESNMAAIVDAAGGRDILYGGARHWGFDADADITHSAFRGGATAASTDVGASTVGQEGKGTIPHALENIFAWYFGMENAVVEATKAFDRHIDSAVPRIALVDYANNEITDAIATANALNGNLYAVRVDTCGENVAQGATNGDRKYWEGTGVTVSGVYALRQGLDAAGHEDVKIILSSGFGDVEKVNAFVEAEKELGVKLFDSLLVGGIYKSRAATMDITHVGNSLDELDPVSKVGRGYRPNDRLELVVGGK